MTLLRKAWPILELFGLGICITFTINQAIIFYMAYSNPDRCILVGVDRFGEAGVEAALYPIGILLAGIAWVRLTWQRAERRRH